MFLPEAEAFRKAAELAVAYKGTASSGRFADFINYYPRRKTADRIVREEFIPNSVTNIGPLAFLGCSEELVFTVEAGSYAEEYCKTNGCAYRYPGEAN